MSHKGISCLEVRIITDAGDLGQYDDLEIRENSHHIRRVKIRGFGCLQKLFKNQKTHNTEAAEYRSELIGRVRSGETLDDSTMEDLGQADFTSPYKGLLALVDRSCRTMKFP